MKISETHIAPLLEKPIRFQEYAVGIFNAIPTKSGIKKAIKKGHVYIDKTLATTSKFIVGGEIIELYQPKDVSVFKQLELDLEVVFEDDYLAVINKPAGILVSGNKFKTIANGLTQNLTKSPQADAIKPKPAHRLDYPTTGLLAIGKTSSAIIALNKLFENREITKTYFAVTIGKMESSGVINFPVDEKNTETHFEVLQTVKSMRFQCLNWVKLSPKTGRKHQLRKHLFAIGNPILGDKEYFLENLILKGKGLYLHAGVLEFTHPITHQKMKIVKEVPEKFKKIFTKC